MIRPQSFDRSGKVPRSALLLVSLILVALAVLFLVSRRSTSHSLIIGGPLLDLDNTTIEEFLLSRDGGQYRFQKKEDGYWTLRGGTTDFLRQSAVTNFLRDLGAAEGGRLFPGTEIEDRRYEFNGPGALRLTVFTADGRRQKLAVGVANPVTGLYYASGLGRPGCFPITAIIRELLAALPASLQLPTLLPQFDRDLVHKVELWYGDELQILQKFEGRWWLRQPKVGVAALGTAALAYHQLYSDRMAVHDGQNWLLANDDRCTQVIYEASEIIVNEIPPPRFAQVRLQEWELDPPWRRVKLFGAGINPDSTEAASGILEIALGMALEDKRVPALRRGNVLMTEGEALHLLSGPLDDFLDLGAITFRVAAGDSMRVTREGSLVLSALRGEAPQVNIGEQKRPLVESWRTIYPTRSQRDDLRELSHNGLTRNLLVNLDRLKILKLLPPTDNARVLSDKERVVFEVFGPDQVVRKLEFGYLVEEFFPGGLLVEDEGLPPVGLWRPDTGKLLQVPIHVLITLRNHADFLKSN